MGMYTGIRCHVKVKSKYLNTIHRLVNNYQTTDDWNRSPWTGLGYDFTDKFSFIDHCESIPFGQHVTFIWDDTWRPSFIDNEWIFQCSLKNYEKTIESFFDLFLSEIVESIITLEVRYEENKSIDRYDLVNGKIEKVNKEQK